MSDNEQENSSNDLLSCPSCGGQCRVAISQSSNPRDTWRKHIVGCNGFPDSDEDSFGEYLKDPCGLEITAFDDERDVDDMVMQWNNLPRRLVI